MGPRGRTVYPGAVVGISLALGPCVAEYTLTGVSPHPVHTGGPIPTRGRGTVICRLQYLYVIYQERLKTFISYMI